VTSCLVHFDPTKDRHFEQSVDVVQLDEILHVVEELQAGDTDGCVRHLFEKQGHTAPAYFIVDDDRSSDDVELIVDELNTMAVGAVDERLFDIVW
jgi:hypothetical protein